jgi:2-(1,2-epoxy-1,2-dihydrophenyl)acetyl-CoA isomerase
VARGAARLDTPARASPDFAGGSGGRTETHAMGAMSQVLLRERHGAVERLWLNRPDQGNVLNDALHAALAHAFRAIALDPSVGAVIVSGKGADFCRSADGQEIGEKYFGDRAAYRSFLVGVRDLHLLMQSVPRPIIAAVNGTAAMGGLELALACDLIVASSAARLGDAHPAGVGGGGASQTLRECVGARMTRWLLYTGEMLDAQRAHQIGLVQQVFPADGFQEAVLALAQRIVARQLGDSLARVKALTVAREPSLADLDLEMTHSVDHYFDPRTQAGLATALERESAGRR